MITENELNISNQSYTKKDFYQIYPEILDLARKLSERWDPQYSNESDPGVVLLKLLAFIADKNNYSIDKRILEVFMPSATQQESMRKLCETMGYNMQYIQSATAEVSFMWNSDEGSLKDDLDSVNGNYLLLPRYTTNITDSETTINYVLLEDVKLTHRYETVTAKAIEGTYITFEINSDNIVLSSNLDDNNRLYLPETEIAENGIFITTNGEIDPDWTKVDNLNIQLAGQKVWKFGFDSLKQKPYIQFPDDVVTLIPNGIKVAYIRSSGINGNISAKKLSALANNELTVYAFDGSVVDDNGEDLVVSAADGNLTVSNLSSANNGANIEDLDSAYKNFKRTVGTFETLINCRDYANAIYEMVKDETFDNNPLVSNVQVGDISNDLNYSHRISTFDGYGVSDKILDDYMTQVDVYESASAPNPESAKKYVKGFGKFNIYLYPLNPIKAYTEKQFNQSFMPNRENIYEVRNQLQNKKSLNHSVKEITEASEAFLIKNYYNLDGKIITNRKLTNYEVIQVQQAVYTALYKNFNSRELNYGEEIPYDQLVSVIVNADSRIKAINLDDPDKETFILYAKADGGVQEHKLTYSSSNAQVKDLYLKFVARNVLAGRAPLFNYDKEFVVKYNQQVGNNATVYGHTYDSDAETKYKYLESADATPSSDSNVTYIKTNLEIPVNYSQNTKTAIFGTEGHTLQENEQVQLLSTKLATDVTYPAYVNYFLHLENATGANAVPAYLRSLDNLGTASSLLSTDKDYPYHYLDYWLRRYGINPTGMTIEDKLTNYKNKVDAKTSVTDVDGGASYKRSVMLYKEQSSLSSYPGNLVSINYHQYTKWTNNYSSLGLAKKLTSLAEFPANNQWIIWECNTVAGEDSVYSMQKCYERLDANAITYIGNIYKQLGYTSVDAFKELLDKKGNDQLASELSSYGFSRLENTSDYDNYSGYTGVWSTDWKSVAGSSGATQYKIDFCNYSVGIDGCSDGISANTIYELRNGDALYVNYTDSNDIIHNIKYTRDTISDNGVVVVSGEDALKQKLGLSRMVIKVNFDIKDSDRYSRNHSFAKTSGFLSDWNQDFAGMFSLGTSDEIRIMKSNGTVVKSASNWYWTTPSNEVIFNKVSEQNNTATYSVILEDGEYVYYTDQAKSSLLTLGSGTELIFTTNSSIAKESGAFKSTLKWQFKEAAADKVTADDILENGLAAFGSVNWQTSPFDGILFDSNNTLTINILDVKTFTEGDFLESITPANGTTSITSITSNSWTSISQLRANNENQCTTISADTTDSVLGAMSHRIRAILNINIGPDLIQTLSNHQDGSLDKVANVVQQFAIYSNYYKDGSNIITNDKIEDYFENIDAVYTEHIGNRAIATWEARASTGLSKVQLKSTVNIQKVGNPNGVQVHTYSISLVRTDATKIYEIVETSPLYIPNGTTTQTETLQINNFNYNYTKIDCKLAKQVTLPIYLPTDTFGLMAIYYTPDEVSGGGPKISYSGCKVYKLTNLTTEIGSNSQIPDSSMLVLKIDNVQKGATITFNSSATGSTTLADGIMLIKDLDIVRKNSSSDIYGFNEKYLGIPSGSALLYNKIRSLDPENNFYWNVPIDNASVLDVDSLDSPEAWTNKNNLFSRYMLPQLNTDSFSNIVVAKSCRVSS